MPLPTRGTRRRLRICCSRPPPPASPPSIPSSACRPAPPSASTNSERRSPTGGSVRQPAASCHGNGRRPQSMPGAVRKRCGSGWAAVRRSSRHTAFSSSLPPRLTARASALLARGRTVPAEATLWRRWRPRVREAAVCRAARRRRGTGTARRRTRTTCLRVSGAARGDAAGPGPGPAGGRGAERLCLQVRSTARRTRVSC